MALKAWYPFIDNVNNQGLGDLDLTVSTAPTYISGGKISSTCLNAGGFKWTAAQTASVFNNNELTIAFWIKVTGTTSGIMIGNDSMGASNNRKFAIFQYPNANSLHWSWMNDTASTVFLGEVINDVFPTNVWTHCCLTYKNPELKVYINGGLIATRTGVSNSSTFAYDTQVLHSNSSRCIQDLRFYDNALSAKEVKLLSQGLVAHYQLKGMGATNYLKGAGKFLKDTPLVRNASDVSHMNDSYIYHETAPNDLFAVLPSAGTYTISVECDGVGAAHPTSGTTASQRLFSFFLQNTSSGTHYHFAMSKGADGRWYSTRTDLVAGTYKVRTNLYAADSVNYTLKFWDMKVTAGNYNPSDTWCPHIDDELYNNLGLGLGNEPDCSGLGNNGIINSTLEAVSGSPRYGSAYKFAGNVNNSICNSTSNFNFTDNFSWACWIKHNYTASSAVGTSFVFTVGRADTGGYGYGLQEISTNTLRVWFGNATYSVTIDENWHHLAFTKSGTAIRIYVDGILQSSATFSGTLPTYSDGNGLGLGCFRYNGGNLYAYHGQLSDFRIYGTALSATDIADLYKNSASLTKDGKLLAYDFHENKRNTIDKDGVVASSGFNDKAIPTYDMKIKALGDGSTWARINHLDATSAKEWFASASEVAKCTDKHNRYSRMGIVDRYKPSDGNYEFMLTYPSMKKTLPAGYTELEYIEATGTQWINTGVTGYARWEFDIQFTNTTKRQLMGYWGSGDEYWGCQTDGKYGLFAGSTIGVAGGRDTIVHDYTAGNYGSSLWVQNQSMAIGGDTAIGSNQYQLFNIMGANYTCHAKLWRCKCVQSGKLIRDFVPAMRNSDGYVGLYDVINNAFYGNSGSGSFVAGGAPSSQYIELYNRWIQTSSPNASPNTGTGFKALTTSWTSYFTPITKSASSSSAVYSMNTSSNWWAPIGQLVTFNGGIPAADGSTQYETELWVRTDRFADETKLRIFNGAITASDFIEL